MPLFLFFILIIPFLIIRAGLNMLKKHINEPSWVWIVIYVLIAVLCLAVIVLYTYGYRFGIF